MTSELRLKEVEERASSYLTRSILAENSQCKGLETGLAYVGNSKGAIGLPWSQRAESCDVEAET